MQLSVRGWHAIGHGVIWRSEILREDVAVWRRDSSVVVGDGAGDAEAVGSVELERLVVARLHVQVHLLHIGLGVRRAAGENVAQEDRAWDWGHDM